MVTVTFTTEGEKLSIRLEGHAGYAEIGKDTICSAVTILAYNVAQYVKMAEENGDLLSKPEIKLDGGDTYISCEPTEEIRLEMSNMFSFAHLGYQLLQHNYPEYVRLIES